MRTSTFLIAIALAILSLTTFSLSQAAPPRQPARPQLHLHRGTFDARLTNRSAPTTALAAAAPGPYAIIQLNGPVTGADRQALEQTGVALLEYLPDYAYLVRGTPVQLEAAAQLPQVYARTSFTLADKLAPALLQALAQGNSTLDQVQIVSWPGAEGTLARDLQTRGLRRQGPLRARQLLSIANLESVRWIEPLGQPRLVNEQARTIIEVDPVWQERRLFGAGQIIAVADSGLDTGDVTTLSPDFAGRLVAAHALAAGGQWDDNFGHGTHVTGSAAGAGVQSGANPAEQAYAGSFAGVAPEAGLVIQAFEAEADGTIVGLDPDYYHLFDQAYADGARLHTNSWGLGPTAPDSVGYGAYPYGAHRTDQFIWDHPDMTIFFAAGNAGSDGVPGSSGACTGGNGVVDPDSLLSPGTAKNVITVGATESNQNSGGFGSFTWGLVSLLNNLLNSNPTSCFTTSPIIEDLVADNPDGLAAFSSRGPTNDGRTKPDIVAPGTNIISNRSHVPSQTRDLWGGHDNPHYAYSGGTSMATPLTAGAGALVRQWLVDQGLATPSAAAVKATLLNTTKIIAPGQYGQGPTQEIPFTQPNHVSGWGRLDLGFMTAPPPYLLWLDDHSTGLSSPEMVTYTHTPLRPLEVLTNTHPLRIMLTWTDPPASFSAAVQLVNDLDLVVTGPGNTTYYGNGVTAGDHTNNVEGVIVNNPPLGRYRIQVKSVSTPVDSQAYALAVAGPFQKVKPPSVTLSKQANRPTSAVGQTIAYTYQVTNSGLITLTGVTGVDDKLGPVPFSAATLEPGQRATGILTYTVQSSDLPGPLVNTVTVSAASGDDPASMVTDTATATVDLIGRTPALVVVKAANVEAAAVGQSLTYTYQVANTGSVTLTNLTGVDDKLGPVPFSTVTLGPDRQTTGILTYTVQSGDLPGPLVNTVSVSGVSALDPAAAVVDTAVATVNVASPTPALFIAKAANAGTAAVGQTLTYTYRVVNVGPVTMTNITGVDDKLGPVPFSPTILAPGRRVTGALTYTVRPGDLPGPLLNTVRISGLTSISPATTITALTTATVDLRSDGDQLYLPTIIKGSL